MRYPFFFITLAALLTSGFAQAQLPSPAAWTARLEPANVAPGANAKVILTAKIKTGWHLYSIVPVTDGPFPTSVTITPGGAIAKVGTVTEAPPLRKLDPNFQKEVGYFEDSAEFAIPVGISKTAKGPISVKAQVRYQLCNEGTCLPPTPATVTAEGTVAGAVVENAGALDSTPPPVQPTNKVQEARQAGLLPYLGLAIGAGFLALLTPCVFPMIPITVSFFSKQKQGSGLKQALAYCGGIIGTFTALGIIVSAVFGAAGLTTLANNPWLNLALAAIFVALALSLFGFFEIGLPSSFTNRFQARGKTGLLAPILMGLTFSLTSFTCTLPFVGAVLVSASQGDYLYPIMGMLGFSTAFCLPFFALAMFPTALSKIPRSGPWLATTKAFMGFIELAAAVKFLSSFDLGAVPGGFAFLTRPVYLTLWFAIFAAAGLYMLGLIKLPKVEESPIGPTRRLLGIGSIALAVWMLFGINGRPIGDLEAFLPPDPYPGREKGETSADGLVWLSSYEQAVAQAKAENKPLFIDFTGIYCTNCRFMERNVFPNPAVKERLSAYVRVKLFTDREMPDDKANQRLLQEMTSSVTLPAYVVVEPNGTRRTTEFTRQPDAFAQFLGRTKVAAN